MPASRPVDLPDFADPPVAETVLSVQFESVTAMRAAHFGMFWGQIIDRFPTTEEHSELSHVVEQFPDQPRSVGIQFEAVEVPPTPRFWFINGSGTELVQLQRDRFIKNWRKVGPEQNYPRYETVREGFESDFSLFKRFVSANNLGQIGIDQCEVTYVNHIVAGRGWDSYADVDKVFRPWSQPNGAVPGKADGVTFNARFPINDAKGSPIGRLHAVVQPVVRTDDGRQMFLFSLTARGQLGNGTEFFDIGRDWIVRSFKELTTNEMHKVWGLKS